MMGYSITMQFEKVRIPYEYCGAAIDGLAAAREKNPSWAHASGNHANSLEGMAPHIATWYAGRTRCGSHANSLEGMALEWGFGIRIFRDGIYIVEFHDEKWGDEYEVFFDIIAPYVTEHAVVTVSPNGEDGLPWRYVFRDDRAVVEHAVLTWVPGRCA